MNDEKDEKIGEDIHKEDNIIEKEDSFSRQQNIRFQSFEVKKVCRIMLNFLIGHNLPCKNKLS